MILQVGPYCLRPGELMCQLRLIVPPAVFTLLLAITLARALLLATADSDGLPGHASGGLQLVITLLLLAVEAALLVQGGLLRREPYLEELKLGRAGISVCGESGWPWLARMLWPAVLLALQTLLSPWTWASRRNYREGLLLSLASIAITCLAAAWVAIYVLCAGLSASMFLPILPVDSLVLSALLVLSCDEFSNDTSQKSRALGQPLGRHSSVWRDGFNSRNCTSGCLHTKGCNNHQSQFAINVHLPGLPHDCVGSRKRGRS